MPELRKLTDKGLEELKAFLALVVDSPDTPIPDGILTDPVCSESLPVSIEVEQRAFSSRMDAANYLLSILGQEGAVALDRSPHMWAWLSLFFFEELCPKKKDGSRKPGEQARWIPLGSAFRYYRHLLAGPYLIYKAFRDDPDRAAIILCGAVDTPGDFVGQLAARQDFVQNKAVIGAATSLYLNPESGKPKRGSSPTERKPGTLRRFIDIVNQFDPTWDLHSMGTIELVAKLPTEFDSYR